MEGKLMKQLNIKKLIKNFKFTVTTNEILYNNIFIIKISNFCRFKIYLTKYFILYIPLINLI